MKAREQHARTREQRESKRHLHGCQRLAPHLRYSGSPLAYSFSEADHRKTMWLIDLAADGSITEERRIDCPQPRRLARLRGRLEGLLHGEEHAWAEECWVQATLTDPARPANPMEELRRRFPHTLQLLFEPERTGGDDQPSYAARVSGRSDLQIAEGFVRHVRPGSDLGDHESAWLAEGFEAVRREAERAREDAR